MRINFSDTGPGLSQGKQNNLFTPFERLGKEGGNIEGSGIGLVITKQLIEMMGGKIWIDSAVGTALPFG